MSQMIPAQFDNDNTSMAERRMFGLLAADPSTKGWIVLHSLGLARKANDRFGEIDFVVLIPHEGIVCLEIKGGRISCNAGVWHTMDRYGQSSVLRKSPFIQAREGMFALRKSIIQHFGNSKAESLCPMGCAVVFPDVACPPLTPEFERSDVIDFDDLRNPISQSIMRIVRRRLRVFQPQHRTKFPTLTEVGAIKRFLRPDFDRIVVKSVSIGQSTQKLLQLTEEQYARLDELDANPRCLFEGAAGTGKTMLALEHARRAERKGSKVLLVCFNRLLGNWLSQQTIGTNITTGSIHQVIRRFILKSSIAVEFTNLEQAALKNGETSMLFEELYPLYGETALEELHGKFDLLVLDEAQDIENQHLLNFLNLALHGGLAGGAWAIFGDFTRQALYGNTLNLNELVSQYSEYFVRARLTLNCRNTRRIAEETSILAGFGSMPFRLGEVDGLPVEHRYWKTQTDLVEALSNLLDNLVIDRVPVDGITILSPLRLENSFLAGTQRISRFFLVDVSQESTKSNAGFLKYSTIHAFKGLESEVVILIDIDTVDKEQSQSLLYVGMSRAQSLLILMINEQSKDAIESRIKRAINRELRRE